LEAIKALLIIFSHLARITRVQPAGVKIGVFNFAHTVPLCIDAAILKASTIIIEDHFELEV
jgi:hypothetical protein